MAAMATKLREQAHPEQVVTSVLERVAEVASRLARDLGAVVAGPSRPGTGHFTAKRG